MLNLNAITVRLGGRTILDRAAAALPPRSRVGLIGRNGAGKSTLMKVMIGQIDPDEGSCDMPRDTRLGYIAQEAPSGTATPFDTVLAADAERAALMAESETTEDPDRLGHIYERLTAIDAYTAPARAARILVGLGFDEEMQGRPLDSYSGGWKMRVGLAALLFSNPDLLLLDEPSNHLDLEATLWLENFLKSYRGTVVVISHERDLLNNVVDYILHLEGGKVTLYPGGYDAFERQRAERLAQQEAARAKALAKMQPIAAAIEDPTLHFGFPSPPELRPPLITMDMASVGYTDTPVLRRVNLRIDPDDRLALLGRNGNGKTTLARLIAAQLAPMEGTMQSSSKMNVGYFTQYQVEELDVADTPLEHMTRVMKGATPGAVRAQLGRFGFSGERATQKVGSMSGGERARLALALITRDAPHLLILDEPTNHLDVDSREALVQALNDYSGAVVIVSHDRHMIELVADRLVLVDNGTAQPFDGSLDDYTDIILRKSDGNGADGAGGGDAPKVDRKAEKREAAQWREKQKAAKNALSKAEKEMAALAAERSRIDQALFDPKAATGAEAKMTTSQLMVKRAAVEKKLEAAEEAWMEASAALEAL